MRDRLKKLTAAAALVLVAGGILVACSDEGGSAGDGDAAGDTLSKSSFFDEVIQAQAEAGTSHVDMTVDVAGQKLTANGDLKIGDSAADTAMAMTMETGQPGMGSLDMRLVDEVFYLNLGPMTSNKFAQVDLKDKSNPLGQQFGDIVGNVDPSQQFKDFEDAVTGFEQKGAAQEIDGVEAQPYVITIDPSKMPAAKQAQGSLPKTLEYTMFIGPDNLPRRMVSDLPDMAGSGGGTMTIDYSKWGEKVTIAKPKASEITKEDFFSQLGSPTPEQS